MNYRIIADATADLTPMLVEEWDLQVIPMHVELDGVSYVFGPQEQGMTPKEFYTRMRAYPQAHTSQIPVPVYEQYFRAAFERDEDVLYIAFSSALSGTYQAAVLAANNLKAEFPERKVRCVDSRSASLSIAMMACAAAQKRSLRRSLDETADWLEKERNTFACWFTLDDMEHLRRSGRANALTAAFGSVLNIRPVMHIDDEGRLVPVERVKGRRKALRALAEKMRLSYLPGPEDYALIAHGDCEDDAMYLMDAVQELTGLETLYVTPVSPIIGVHTNAGIIALFFRANRR